jgi:hypothetical protein
MSDDYWRRQQQQEQQRQDQLRHDMVREQQRQDLLRQDRRREDQRRDRLRDDHREDQRREDERQENERRQWEDQREWMRSLSNLTAGERQQLADMDASRTASTSITSTSKSSSGVGKKLLIAGVGAVLGVAWLAQRMNGSQSPSIPENDATSTLTCPSCGQENRATYRFCMSCGSPISSS